MGGGGRKVKLPLGKKEKKHLGEKKKNPIKNGVTVLKLHL